MTKWESYEEVAAHLLERFAAEFGLDRVEGKQKIPGKTGTDWEIDAKGIVEGEGGIMVVECRRHTTKKQTQEQVGGLAYKITDSGADGGIYVSPLGFQKGAKKVADAEDIIEVTLTPDSTPTDFEMGFLSKFHMGVSTTLFIKGEAKCEVVRRTDQVSTQDDHANDK